MAETLYRELGRLWSDSPRICIPRFQRDFSWKGNQITQLLNDIDSIPLRRAPHGPAPAHKHFLGLLVFVEQIEEGGDGEKVYFLVDGQQRLSALLVIAAGAKDAIKEYLASEASTVSDQTLFRETYQEFDDYVYMQQRPRVGPKRPRLTASTNDADVFEILVLEEGSLQEKKERVQKRLGKRHLHKPYFKAYENVCAFIKERVKESGITYVVDLFVKMNYGLTFIPFVASTDTDAFNLFETLNDRGLNLSAVDLIKNKVLQQAGRESIGQCEEEWNDVFGKDGIIPARAAQFFLRNFLMVRHGHISNNEVYEKCQTHLHSPSEARDFLAQLGTDARHFFNIFRAQDDETPAQGKRYIRDPQVAELVFLLGRTRVKQWFSVGYAAYSLHSDKRMTEKELAQILRLLLNIVLRLKLLDKRFNYIETTFPELAYVLRNAKVREPEPKDLTRKEATSYVLDGLQSVLSERAPNKEVRDLLNAGVNFEDDNDLATILLRSIWGRTLAHGESLHQGLTLEHVLPEKYRATWGDIPNGDTLKYSLGNMLLVEGPLNSELRNLPFADKLEIYRKRKVIDPVRDESLRYEHADQSSWVKKFIRAREKDLLAQVAEFLETKD